MLFWCVSFQFSKNALGTHHTWVSLSPTPTPILLLKVTVSPVAGTYSFCPQSMSGESWGLHLKPPDVQQSTARGVLWLTQGKTGDQPLQWPFPWSKSFDNWLNGCGKIILNSREESWLVAYWFTGLVLSHSCLLSQGCEMPGPHSWLS